VQQALAPGERFTATFDAEDTDFVRMNRGKVRQPGSVSQRYSPCGSSTARATPSTRCR
jgi:hypothetical protein